MLKKAIDYLILDPIEKRSAGLVPLRIAQLLHERTGGKSDIQFRKLGKLFKPRESLPPSVHMSDAQIEKSVTSLNQQGWDILPWRMDANDIAEIRKFAFSTPAWADDPREEIKIDESNPPRARPRYLWRMSDIVRVPAVQRLISDSALHDIAQRYIGCLPVLTSVELWLDPVFDGEYAAHVYHYDNDGPAFLKYFIYLNDVDTESGAHTYIEGSQTRSKPESFRISKRYGRDELLNHYGQKSEIVFAAPAGTILAEDTAGFHKGTTLRKGNRVLLQLQYAMIDIPHREEFLLSIKRAHIEGLNPTIRKIGRKFFV